MGDKLVGYFRCEIGGTVYENGSESDVPGQPVSLEIEHRDDESSRLTLTVFDNMPMGQDPPYPEFNRFPNPRKVESIPVLAWAGWEGEEIVKMFEGNLIIKSMDEEIPSHTKFVALHDSYKLRKKAKVDVPKGITTRMMLIRKAAEHGCVLKFDASADEPALDEPMEVFHQIAEANWDLMNRYIKSLGFVTINKERNVLIVMRDKTSGTVIALTYGDENIKRLSLREENKKASHHPKRRGHHHEGIAGKHAIYPPTVAVPGDSGKGVEWREQPLAKHVDSHRKITLAKASTLGKGKRLKVEGDQLDVHERFRPIMVNHEVYVVNGYGPDIDDAYQTAMVRHRMGPEWTTESTCWRP